MNVVDIKDKWIWIAYKSKFNKFKLSLESDIHNLIGRTFTHYVKQGVEFCYFMDQ